MRFLVDLYRFLLLAALGLGVVAASYVVFALFMQNSAWKQEFGGLALIAVIVVGVLVILSIGLTATFISMHDRMADIAENTDRIATALERRNEARNS